MTETRFRQAFLLLLVAAISAAFVAMIRAFLLTILLAAIFAGLSYPAYEWILGRVRGRKALAAIATLLLLLVLVMAPLLAVLGAGANEALRVTETIRPRLQQLVDQPGEFDSRLRALPGYDRIEPYRAQILTKAGELVGSTSAFLGRRPASSVGVSGCRPRCALDPKAQCWASSGSAHGVSFGTSRREFPRDAKRAGR